MTLASAFFTGIIGIHPIFGAFLIGLICPHDGGFAIKLTEKIEDLVTVFFLPLYFALSGLSTNIGLLDSGITWAYVIGVVSVAFAGFRILSCVSTYDNMGNIPYKFRALIIEYVTQSDRKEFMFTAFKRRFL